MPIIKTLSVIAAGAALLFSSATAEDDEHAMSMISIFELDPAKEGQFDKAWKTIRETAMDSEYSYTDFVGGWRNQRWIVTPLKNFADVDAVMAARDAVGEGGGRKFEKALASFYGSITEAHTFFTHDDMALSYWPNGAPSESFMEIDTFYYDYGARDEMRSILEDWKALMTEKESPYGYQVSWDGIGSPGNSVTIISYAADAVAMAEANAAIDAMIDGDEEAAALFKRFLDISTGSETFNGEFNAEASINLPDMGGE